MGVSGAEHFCLEARSTAVVVEVGVVNLVVPAAGELARPGKITRGVEECSSGQRERSLREQRAAEGRGDWPGPDDSLRWRGASQGDYQRRTRVSRLVFCKRITIGNKKRTSVEWKERRVTGNIQNHRSSETGDG